MHAYKAFGREFETVLQVDLRLGCSRFFYRKKYLFLTTYKKTKYLPEVSLAFEFLHCQNFKMAFAKILDFMRRLKIRSKALTGY